MQAAVVRVVAPALPIITLIMAVTIAGEQARDLILMLRVEEQAAPGEHLCTLTMYTDIHNALCGLILWYRVSHFLLYNFCLNFSFTFSFL